VLPTPPRALHSSQATPARASVDNTQSRGLHLRNLKNCPNKRGHLSLSRLTRAQSQTIVSGLSGAKALPRGLLEQIISRTDGVPLFVAEAHILQRREGMLEQRVEWVAACAEWPRAIARSHPARPCATLWC
jgi:hypothetical protein